MTPLRRVFSPPSRTDSSYRYASLFAGHAHDHAFTTHEQPADPQELEKFSDLAQPLVGHRKRVQARCTAINPLRLDWIDQCAQPRIGKKVLDVGCGGGILSESMAQRGANVLGIDLSTKALKVAGCTRWKSGVSGVEYREVARRSAGRRTPGQFDTVTCMEMLEHVPDPASVVAACARLVKPGGWCSSATLNRNAKAFLFAIVGAEHVLKLLPKGTHEYAKFIRPSELSGFAATPAWRRSAWWAWNTTRSPSATGCRATPASTT